MNIIAKLNQIIILIFIVVLITGCAKSPSDSGTVDSNKKVTNQLLKGVSLSPKSFEANDFTDFFAKAKQAGEIVSWAGDWNELSNTQNGGPTVVASLASAYGYTPIIEAQFFTQSNRELIRPLDESTKQGYKDSIVAFVEKYKPDYIGLGIEINVLYEKSPGDFDDFVSFYNEVYDTVKKTSPNTKVFTVFQLEKMKGLDGGLFGGKNDPAKAQWSLIDKLNSDIVAFTTYPGLIYKNPSDIPSDYYTELNSRTTKPVAFTEIGWHSSAGPVGWESSDAEQAEFITYFFNLTKDLNREFVIWSFMYDPDSFEPFNSMGLYNKDGNAKPAWDEWLKAE